MEDHSAAEEPGESGRCYTADMIAKAMLLSALAGLSVSSVTELEPSIAKGATRVPFVDVLLSADCQASDPVSVSALHLRHRGMGDARDLERVYALSGPVRVSSAQSFDRNGILALRLQKVTLAPCEDLRLTVAATVAADAAVGSEHRIELQSVTYGDGKSLGVAMQERPSARVAPVTSAPPTFTLRELPGRITYGAQRRVARFLVSHTDKDGTLTAVTLTNDGSARNADLQQLVLTDARGRALTAVVPALASETVTLRFVPPLLLRKGSDLLLELRADVRASRKKTVRFAAPEDSAIQWQGKRGR